MQSFSIAAIFALAASIASAAPAVVELQPRTYPTVATIEAQMGAVDQDYLEELKTIVINLDEGAEAKRGLESRQSGVCNVQGLV